MSEVPAKVTLTPTLLELVKCRFDLIHFGHPSSLHLTVHIFICVLFINFYLLSIASSTYPFISVLCKFILIHFRPSSSLFLTLHLCLPLFIYFSTYSSTLHLPIYLFISVDLIHFQTPFISSFHFSSLYIFFYLPFHFSLQPFFYLSLHIHNLFISVLCTLVRYIFWTSLISDFISLSSSLSSSYVSFYQFISSSTCLR